MKHFLIFFFSVFLSIASFSQSKEELSQLSFEALKDSIEKYQFIDMEKALNASAAHSLKGKRENNKDEEWFGKQSTVMVYVFFRKFDEANKEGEKALEFARRNNLEKFEMDALLILGDLHGIITTGEEQLSIYSELLAVAESSNNDLYREVAFSRIARVHDISGNSEKALELYKKSIAYYLQKPIDSSFTQINKNSNLVNVYSSLALSHLKLEQIDSAKLYSAKINNFQAKELDSCYTVYSYLLKAEIAYEEKKFDEARTNYEKGYSVCPSEYDLMQLVFSTRNL